MPRLVRKPHYLIFYRRAVPRARARYQSRMPRRLRQRLANYIVRFAVGVTEIAYGRIFRLFLGKRGKRIRHVVAVLYFQLGKVYRFSRKPRGRARLEPAQPEAERPQRRREILASRKAYGTVRLHALAAYYRTVEINARRYDDGLAHINAARDALDYKVRAAPRYAFHFVLSKRQVIGGFERGLGKRMIFILVRLRAQ